MVKEKKKKFKISNYFLLFVSLIMISTSISAAGVANSYWDDNPLKLAPGESTIASLRLQSDGGDTILKAKLENEIATLVEGPEYSVGAGETVPVNISVKIPKDVSVGTAYSIYVDFQEISTGEGGLIHVAQGITSKIPVLVVGQEESILAGQKKSSIINSSFLIGIILLLAIIVAIFISIRKRKYN